MRILIFILKETMNQSSAMNSGIDVKKYGNKRSGIVII